MHRTALTISFYVLYKKIRRFTTHQSYVTFAAAGVPDSPPSQSCAFME